MTYRAATKITALVATAIALAAPRASAQVSPGPGSYRLAEVAGRALPAVVEQEDDCREEVTAAVLTLTAEGRYSLVVSEREVCGDRIEEDEERDEGTYSVEGTTVRFSEEDEEEDDDSEGEIEVDEISVGTLSGGVLSVRLRDGETLLVFRQ